MEHIGKWINDILISWGIKPSNANNLDEIVITLLMISITIGLNFISQTILIKNLKKFSLFHKKDGGVFSLHHRFFVVFFVL